MLSSSCGASSSSTRFVGVGFDVFFNVCHSLSRERVERTGAVSIKPLSLTLHENDTRRRASILPSGACTVCSDASFADIRKYTVLYTARVLASVCCLVCSDESFADVSKHTAL